MYYASCSITRLSIATSLAVPHDQSTSPFSVSLHPQALRGPPLACFQLADLRDRNAELHHQHYVASPLIIIHSKFTTHTNLHHPTSSTMISAPLSSQGSRRISARSSFALIDLLCSYSYLCSRVSAGCAVCIGVVFDFVVNFDESSGSLSLPKSSPLRS